jgi:hypothetical protein
LAGLSDLRGMMRVIRPWKPSSAASSSRLLSSLAEQYVRKFALSRRSQRPALGAAHAAGWASDMAMPAPSPLKSVRRSMPPTKNRHESLPIFPHAPTEQFKRDLLQAPAA